jgi:hypothetical protein
MASTSIQQYFNYYNLRLIGRVARRIFLINPAIVQHEERKIFFPIEQFFIFSLQKKTI